MTKKLNIALDYDNTFTADPNLWTQFIKQCRLRGHKVWIVTMRSKEDQTYPFASEVEYLRTTFQVKTILCDGEAKKDVVEELGIKIDIWIDDDPNGIINGSSLTPEQLELWRINDRY